MFISIVRISTFLSTMLRELVVLLALTSVALAALTLAPLQIKPDKFRNVEGCYIDDLKEVIPIGKSAPCKHHCMEYRCRSTNLQVVTCGKAIAAPPCRLVEDHSKSYPECCPKIVCP